MDTVVATTVFGMQTSAPGMATAVLMLLGACTLISLTTCSDCENDKYGVVTHRILVFIPSVEASIH